MSDAAVASEDLLANAESMQQSIDQAAPEASKVLLPAAHRAPSMGPYYALLGAAIVAPAILFGIVAWQTRVYMLRGATTEVARTVELAAHQAHDLLQIDQLLAERVNEYTRSMTWDAIQHSEALHLYLKGLAAEYPQAGVIFLADGSGSGRASNLVFPQPPISAADRSLHAEEARTLGLNDDLRQRARDLAASNAELETFSYSVSHDLRTPLRAIDGYSAILVKDYTEKLDIEGRRLLSVVRQATAKMSRLIDDILDFSRTGRLPMNATTVDMVAQVRGLIEEAQAHVTDRHLRFELGELPTVRGDASMIRRVWFNLIDNAIKFTATKPNAVITIGATQAENEVVYSVVDNGIGFDRQYLGMLFGVGHRLVGVEFEGCGVGLAIVKRIVVRHNGRVWADGIPNEGATFYFALPAQQVAG